MKALLSEGIRVGRDHDRQPATEMLARCVIGVQWIPENILRDIGARGVQIHVRDTMLRGAAMRDATASRA